MTTTRMRLSLSSSKSLASKLRRRCHLHSLPATPMAAAFSCMEGRVLVHKQNHHRPKQGSQRSLSCLMNKPHDVTDTLSLSSAGHRLRNTSTPVQVTVRCFETESEYHSTADEALETIQDELDAVLEDVPESEVNFASGVLTISLPPSGTWVINKQTPNKQLWWSSPLSGPKRFEYNEKDNLWFSTKEGLRLGPLLAQELRHCFPNLQDFDLDL